MTEFGSEQRRLAALHAYQLLDAPADDELKAVVRVAATIAGVPSATLNLIDEHRQCQLTTTGFVGVDSPRSDSMCAVRLAEGEFVQVPDASLDPTYRDNPWVTGARAGSSIPVRPDETQPAVVHETPMRLEADGVPGYGIYEHLVTEFD